MPEDLNKSAESTKSVIADLVQVPKIDEGELLQDVRSPRFLAACQKLKIDPLDLKPKTLDDFKEKGLDIERQEVRLAMYERGRFNKWKQINETRFSLPVSETMQRAKSAGAMSMASKKSRESKQREAAPTMAGTWIAAEFSRTQAIWGKGRTEVFKASSKKLRDITAVGKMVMKDKDDREAKERENRAKAEQKRKQLIKKHAEEQKRQAEKARKEREAMNERERQFKEMDDAARQKQQDLYEKWAKEAAEKQKERADHMHRIHGNISAKEQERDQRKAELLESLHEKSTRIERKQSEWMKGGDTGMQEKANAAEQRRQDLIRTNLERGKALLAEYKRAQAEVERKEGERREKAKEKAKERKEKEHHARKRIADIQKKAKAVLKEKTEKILEHMDVVEQNLKEHQEQRKKEMELKHEIERLKFEQVQERLLREKARQKDEADELWDKFQRGLQGKKERDAAIQKLLQERQLQATQIRLQKDQMNEEIFQIQVNNQWTKANQLLRDMDQH